MKEVIIYYSMLKDGRRIQGSRKMQVPEEMYVSWDWTGIEKIFLRRFRKEDRHNIRVQEMKIGKFTLQE